jgi:hypothetical protein
MIMDTAQKIKEAFDTLNSNEGTLQFIAQRTYLPMERVERIYQLGSPWPLLNDAPEGVYFTAIQEGESTVEGDSIEGALNALASLRSMDIESQEKKLDDFLAAQERSEKPDPIPGLEWSESFKDHFDEVARLSGEELSTIHDVFLAEISRHKQMLQLLQKMASLKAQEGQP